MGELLPPQADPQNPPPRYGSELRDQVELIASVSEAHSGLLSDVREFIRDRAALEREYASKLQALTKKATEKRAKRMPAVILGNEPSKVWTEDTVKMSTLDTAYRQLLASFEETAQAHITFADNLINEVANELKVLEKRKEDTKKIQMGHYHKLIAERDKVYAERTKAKQKYYDECGEMEGYRQKQERSTGDRHSDRAAKQYESQKTDMFHCKNNFIIATALANTAHEKFYEVDLPALEDELQDAQANTILRLVDILLQSQSITHNHLDLLRTKIETAETVFGDVNVPQDQSVLVTWNLRPYSPPKKFTFEPCTIFYENDELNTEPAPKIFLQNKLNRAQLRLTELEHILFPKERELEAHGLDFSIVDEDDDDIVESYLDKLHQLTFYSLSHKLLLTEIDTITTALGEDLGLGQMHVFKGAAFSIPTPCAACGSSIWGLAKQGKTCKLCGVSVHAKCELKVPADCRANTTMRSTLQHGRTGSLSSTRSDSRANKYSPTIGTTPSSFAPQSEDNFLAMYGTIVFDFNASSPYELSVSEGTRVRIVEPDDGSGWVKIANDGTGDSGLVPATYVKGESAEDDDAPSTNSGSLMRPSMSHDYADSRSSINRASFVDDGDVVIHGSGTFVRALYNYEAQGDDEISLSIGQEIELTAGEMGGTKYGEGWWEGIDPTGRLGIFPSNYVRLVME